MKRRVISFITVLALCLSLCPAPALAAGQEPEAGLCPHHEVHTEECGYVPAAAGRDCTHEHDENCVVTDGTCGHRHDESCGYAGEETGAACTFVCRICPAADLTDMLPGSAAPDDGDRGAEDLPAVLGPYTEPAEGEQEPPDAANTPFTIAGDTTGGIPSGLPKFQIEKDKTVNDTYIISVPYLFETNGHTYTVSGKTAIRVTKEGAAYLTTGTVQSTNGAGIEIESGCALYVTKQEMNVIGTTYGLDISSGTDVRLSGGTYTGKKAAIHLPEDDGVDGSIAFSDLLVTGYAYFDENGNVIQPEDVGGLKTVVVHACTDHTYSYTSKPGSPAHIRTCTACGTDDVEPCTFEFDETGSAKCKDCGHTIAIVINLGSLVYDGNSKPASVNVEVKLDGATLPAAGNYSYKLEPLTRDNVGEITITVTGISYNGTFEKTYEVIKDTPKITWNPNGIEVDYKVDKTALLSEIKTALLSKVIIDITATGDIRSQLIEKLKAVLAFSYAEAGSANFVDGLPTDAGTYEITASLPEQENYEAAASNGSIILEIKPITPIIVPPKSIVPNLIYNGAAQELVIGGTANPGAEIQYALDENGPYSKDIPTGTNAGSYTVWYKTVGSNNYDYTGTSGSLPVTIDRKSFKPDVKLSYYTCVYDGGFKEPGVTVKDGETVLPQSEYDVAYSNNQAVGTATVTVTDKPGGNYNIQEAKVTFEITPQDQTALTVTNRPNTVTYGDKFTLGTSGGSGNGAVTWKIIDGEDVATIDPKSGQVSVIGVGEATVRATKSGVDADPDTPDEGAGAGDSGAGSDDNNKGNHKDAIADWTFTAEKKPIVATVTADSKTYDGNDKATVHIEVKQGVVSGDVIKFLPEVEGTFDGTDARPNRIVTVDTTNVQISDQNLRGKYNVTYSNSTTPVTADIFKAEASIPTVPTGNTRDYDGTAQDLITGAAAEPTTTVDSGAEQPEVEYARSKDGPYSPTIPQATNAGDYEVWYRVKETTNYVGTAADKVDVTIKRKEIADPVILLAPDDGDTEGNGKYKYTGSAIEPAVTVKEDQSTVDTISSAEYTVAYKDNVNVGMAAVTVTAKADGNYKFEKKVEFEIIKSSSAVLTSHPQALDPTYNGKPQNLVTAGTAANGHLVYALQEGSVVPAEDDYKPEIPQRTAAGSYTVYYKVKGENNYDDTLPASVSVDIHPKSVSDPVITLAAASVAYTGIAQTVSVTSVKDGDVEIETNEYTTSYSNNINAGTAVVHIIDNPGGNYIVSGSKTFEITKIKAEFSTEPGAKQGLVYTGKAQPLVTAGTSNGGTVVYSWKDGTYSTAIPTGTDLGTYEVWAKVQGDANHEDSDVKSITVQIGVNNVSEPVITLSSYYFQYNGSEHRPAVTVKDDYGNVIDPGEYAVTYTNNINVGTDATVTVKGTGKNYIFEEEAKFTIGAADQTPLTITGKPSVVYYGDTIQLGTTGGSGAGTVTWSIEEGEAEGRVTMGASEGQFIITDTGRITIKATRASSTSNYGPAEDTWQFFAYPKPVTAVVTVADKVYNGQTDAQITHVEVSPSDLVDSGDTVTFAEPYSYLTAVFTNANAGTNKQVKLTATADGYTSDKYKVSYPAATTASITPAAATVTGVEAEALTYNGNRQELVKPGTATGGQVAYSLDGTSYQLNVPTGIGAGEYTVWYKVVATDTNYKDSIPGLVKVKIEKATPAFDPAELTVSCNSGQKLKDIALNFITSAIAGTFAWKNGDDEPTNGIAYDVIFTPNDTANYETVTIQVTVTVVEPTPGGTETPTAPSDTTPAANAPSTESKADMASASVQASVQNGAASAALTAEAGETLVNEAIAAQSANVVIRPEITGEVTKTEVSIPGSAVSRIANETNAALTVSTPVADVSIPNAGLEALAHAGGTVSVVTEQINHTVVLTLLADGKDVGEISGGLTLTVPAADAGPGTVAVLVHEDGTRETIRWSVAGDGSVRIPLSGSATVEIVDNSKEFTDVPAESWVADAVAFTSAHELFNGTGELTFSPEQAMSRAMLATVLYNLEGQPEQDLTDGFSDVSGGAWYAAGVSWASANGITGGYGDGQFGPDDSVTREQFAVMLWRYAGSPIAEVEALSFTDADQVSGYAEEALAWAAAKGILNGHSDGRLDPGGLATRAQAAQILKNLIENA